LQQFQSLCTQFRRKDGEPSSISAGPRKTADEPRAKKIVADRNNRYSACGLLGYFSDKITKRGDDVDFQANQFRSQLGKLL
jgi:hypothetical protein